MRRVKGKAGTAASPERRGLEPAVESIRQEQEGKHGSSVSSIPSRRAAPLLTMASNFPPSWPDPKGTGFSLRKSPGNVFFHVA
jgi:hypothetical protein